VALVRTDISGESSASIIRVTRIGELGIKLAVTSNLRTLRRKSTKYLGHAHRIGRTRPRFVSAKKCLAMDHGVLRTGPVI
jgi:hypothetical protein